MAGEHDIGGIKGYLRLDKSQWSAEIAAARGQAADLARSNPKITISTNSKTAIAQLEAVAVAAKRLQDAQGKVAVAQAKLNELQATGNASASRLASAQQNLSRATRDVEVSQIRLASAYEKAESNAESFGRTAETATKNVGLGAANAGGSLRSLLIPAIGAAVIAIGPLAAVGGAAFAPLLLGASGLKDEVVGGLTPAFRELQAASAIALEPGVGKAVLNLQSALPKLIPLLKVFGDEIGRDAEEFTHWLDDGGIEDFTKYAEAELPIVRNLFVTAAQAAGDFFKQTQAPANALLETVSELLDDYHQLSQVKLPGGGKDSSVLGSIQDQVSLGPELRGAQSLGSGVKGGLSRFYGQFQNQSALAGAASLANAASGESSLRSAANTLDAVAKSAAAANISAGIAEKYRNANGAVAGLVTQMQAFGASENTALDRAQLLGAVLKASQGDALSYSAAIAGGYDATRQLLSAFQGQAGDPSIAFKDTELAAINLKTGLINLKAAGAVPLVQQLQAMQDAAQQAAQALYQHEVGTKGDSQAADDAIAIFNKMTNGALVDNYKQLGLNKDQAKKLADQYFSMNDTDVKATFTTVGLSDINTTLQQIGRLLANFTGQVWTIPVDIAVSRSILAVETGTTVARKPGVKGGKSAGGPVSDGLTPVGEVAPEWLEKQGSTVRVLTLAQASSKYGVTGPGIGSPAAHAVQAGYNTPTSRAASRTLGSQPTMAQIHTHVMLDGHEITRVVDEVHLQNDRG